MATCLGFTTVPGDCHSADLLTVIHNFDLKRSDGSTAAPYLADSSQICLTIWLNTWVIYHNPES